MSDYQGMQDVLRSVAHAIQELPLLAKIAVDHLATDDIQGAIIDVSRLAAALKKQQGVVHALESFMRDTSNISEEMRKLVQAAEKETQS